AGGHRTPRPPRRAVRGGRCRPPPRGGPRLDPPPPPPPPAGPSPRHTGGVFVLRIEDTDQSRVLPAYIDSALETLRWLGLDWDEGPEVGGPYGPYLQSERMAIYADWVAKFLESGHAYWCYCTPEELAERR